MGTTSDVIGTPYASDKIAFHLPVLEQLRRGEQPNPIHVQIILSDLCNQDCSFCSYRWSGDPNNELFSVMREDGTVNNNPNRMLPTAKALEVLDDLAAMGTKAVQFTGGGEPTVHPDHISIMQRALDLGLDAALVTNGMLWKEAIYAVLTRLTWIRISLDAGNADTYSSIRRVSPAVFDRVSANVARLAAERKKCDSKTTIGISFVVTKENWKEIVTATRRAKQLGADSIRMTAIFQPDGTAYYDGWRKDVSDLCQEAKKEASDGFAVINMFDQRFGDLEAGSPKYSRCLLQEVYTYVAADQRVYRCCVLAYNSRGIIGSIESQSFRQLWESTAKRADFSQFDARGCPNCRFNDKNAAMENLVKLPQHVNFV